MARRPRGSLLVPLILIAGGALLLLDNFGAIDVELWDLAARYWPVLLIALGVDLAFGRSSVERTIVSVLAVLAVVFAAFVTFQVFAPDEWTLREHAVHVDLRGVTEAQATVCCSACSIELAGPAAPGVLIEGIARVRRTSGLSQQTSRGASQLTYELVESRWSWLPRWSWKSTESVWEISASQDPTLDLSLEAGGRIDADLTGLSVTSVEIRSDEGRSRLVLSSTNAAQYRVSTPELDLVVPSDLGLRVESAAAVADPLPAGFVQSGSAVVSANWSTAPVRSTVVAGPDVEEITFVSLDEADTPPTAPPET